jgi:hypothetical protein
MFSLFSAGGGQFAEFRTVQRIKLTALEELAFEL